MDVPPVKSDWADRENNVTLSGSSKGRARVPPSVREGTKEELILATKTTNTGIVVVLEKDTQGKGGELTYNCEGGRLWG